MGSITEYRQRAENLRERRRKRRGILVERGRAAKGLPDMLSFREKLCYNEENNPNKKCPARCGTLCSKRKEVEGMKYRWMVVCLCACLVLFSGCASRKGEEDALPRQEVELVDEAGEEAPEIQPEETPEEEPETKPEETPSQPEETPESGSQPEETPAEEKPAAGQNTQQNTEQTAEQNAHQEKPVQPAASTQSSSFSQQQKQWFDTFQSQMTKAFDRKAGTIVVAQDDQGKKSLRELDYDVTNAYDKEGETVENAEIEADMTIAQTMQTSLSYGSGDREVYERYSDFRKAKEALMTPLLEKGVKLENLSNITREENQDGSCITLEFDASAVRKYQTDLPSDLSTEARMQLDGSGELVSLTVEQYRVKNGKQEGYSTTEYTFR